MKKLGSELTGVDQFTSHLLSCCSALVVLSGSCLVALSGSCSLHGASWSRLLLLWNEEYVFVLFVLAVFLVDIVTQIRVSVLVEIVLDLVQVMALRLHPLEELLLLLSPEVALFFLLGATQALLLRQLALEGTLLRIGGRVGRDASPPEVVKRLAWYFL